MFNLLFPANKFVAQAVEDELDDVDIEGEDNPIVGEEILDEAVVKSSQYIDTTILFTKPSPNYGDSPFGKNLMYYIF